MDKRACYVASKGPGGNCFWHSVAVWFQTNPLTTIYLGFLLWIKGCRNQAVEITALERKGGCVQDVYLPLSGGRTEIAAPGRGGVGVRTAAPVSTVWNAVQPCSEGKKRNYFKISMMLMRNIKPKKKKKKKPQTSCDGGVANAGTCLYYDLILSN